MLRTSRGRVDDQIGGQTALFVAVEMRSKELVELLLEHKADPGLMCSVTTQDGHAFEWSAMHEACRRGDASIVAALAAAGCDVNLPAHHRMTPIHVAAWHGNNEVIHTLVNAGCDADQLDRFQESALVIPICHGDTAVVNTLLDAGCKLNTRSWGNTRKIRGKHESDYRETLYGRHGPYTLLLLAIKYSWLHIAVILLQHGFNPNKYQIHDILKSIKSNIGCIDSEGVRLVRCFVTAGYRFREKDPGLLDGLLQLDDHGYDEELIMWLKQMATQPSTLQELARNAVRKYLRMALQNTSIIKHARALFLPRSLIDDLCMVEFDEPRHKMNQDRLTDQKVPLYFAMPRKRGDKERNVYLQFWLATCCRKS